MSADATGLVEAARGLWPLLLFVFLIMFVVLFRSQIAALLGRLERPRTRRGEAEGGDLAPRGTSIVILDESEVAPSEPSPFQDQAVRAARAATASEAAFVEMIDAFERSDIEKADAAYRRLETATTDPSERVAYQAWREFFRHDRAQDLGALHRLRTLAGDHPENPIAAILLGQVLIQTGDPEGASASFQDAARVADDAVARASYLSAAALALAAAGHADEGSELLYAAIADEPDPLALSGLHRGLAELFDRSGETELQVVALERATELAPNDAELHFSLASVLSREDTRSHLALLHYVDAVRFKADHDAALNNLAVQYDRFLLPGKAADAYRRSAASGSTLAMGNLASKYLSEGFVDEAATLLTEAMRTGTPHERVAAVFERLKGTERYEDGTEDELLQHGRHVQAFLRRMAERAFAAGSPDDLAGQWSGSNGERLELDVAGGAITGTFKGSSDAAALSLSGSCVHASAAVLLRRAGGIERNAYLYREADHGPLRLMQELPTGDVQEHELSPATVTTAS